ncbi:MAG TPA: hypothetical protein DCY91_20970 [Cyanobacteria bacterium UBA11370]|nr:hypothetical protein [Cyanobacteria bacterium UBA11370]HBY76864.1 hypothetical protein [Cyanobacteria bacterium UBA11148]
MDKYEFALRTALAIYNHGWNSLSVTEEMALQSIPEYRDRVYEYLRLLREGKDPTRAIRKVILDKPLRQYLGLLGTASKNGAVHVDFLCSDSGERDLHFFVLLGENGNDITWKYLNIPINEWDEWKKRPEYKGE